MSLHPDVIINAGTAVPGDVPVTALAAQGFMTAITQRGALTPILSQSFAEWEANHGSSEATGGYGRVAAETFFRMGGSRLWTSRYVGPAAATATVKLFDQSGAVDPGDVALIVSATSPGAWANGATSGLSVEVYTTGVTAGSFVLIIRLNGAEVERSPELLDQAAAVTWATKSKYIRVALGASPEDPRAAAAANLTGGADDLAGITETERTAALARFTMALGPGRVFAPGVTTATGQTKLLEHGKAFDRVPLLDTPNTGTVATITAAASTQRALRDTANAGGMVGPWAVVPGSVNATTRLVPYSAVAAGVSARNLADGVPVGQASAGVQYGRPGDWVLGLAVNDDQDPSTVKWVDADLDALHQAGVNVAYRIDGRVTLMGYRTLVDEAVDDRYVDLAGVELLHFTNSQMRSMLRRMQMGRIDAKRQFFSRIEEQAEGILQPLFLAGVLFGETAEQAFKIDAGPGVNTSATIAARQAAVSYAIKTSPTAERMIGTHIKVATEGSLA